MVFTVLGAVAELERSLIAERVKAGLRNAKAKGQKLGQAATTGTQHRRDSTTQARQKKGNQFQKTCPRPGHFSLERLLFMQEDKGLANCKFLNA